MVFVVKISAFGWGLEPKRSFIVSLPCFFGGVFWFAFFCCFIGIEETFYD